MSDDKRKEKLQALRQILDWYELHPEIPLPGGFASPTITSVNTKEDLEVVARAFGTCRKIMYDTIYQLVKKFGPITLSAVWYREQVCTRRVVGTKTVEEEVPIGFRTQQVVQEIVEWDCPKILQGEINENE